MNVILVVDDNEINGILIEQILKTQYETIRVTSGAEALKVLRERVDVRVIVSDIVMPEMSGLELLRTIKESFLLKDIPVILCSILADIDKVRLAGALGCTSYILKPVQRDVLLQKVAQALGNVKPVVASEQDIMAKNGMNKLTYDQVLRSYVTLLEAQCAALESRLSGAPAQLELKQVAEGAEVFGAEKLRSRIMDIFQGVGNKADVKLDLMKILRDMQHLSSLLKARTAVSGATATANYSFGQADSDGTTVSSPKPFSV